jgi:formylglycine-generating enzyme required for sulfatase activity
LPSESEWEYACRAGSSTQYFWSNQMKGSYCWYSKNSGAQTHPVSMHREKINVFGLVDMSGNVWEWCQDQWIVNYKDGPYDSKPRTSNSLLRVVRGGSWFSDAKRCRSGYRDRDPQSDRFNRLGFRVFRSIP